MTEGTVCHYGTSMSFIITILIYMFPEGQKHDDIIQLLGTHFYSYCMVFLIFGHHNCSSVIIYLVFGKIRNAVLSFCKNSMATGTI